MPLSWLVGRIEVEARAVELKVALFVGSSVPGKPLVPWRCLATGWVAVPKNTCVWACRFFVGEPPGSHRPKKRHIIYGGFRFGFP